MNTGARVVFNLSCFSSQRGLKMHLTFPGRWKLLSSLHHLPLRWVHFHLCELSSQKDTSDGDPHAGRLPLHPFSPSPLAFSQVKSSGPLRPGLQSGLFTAQRSGGLVVMWWWFCSVSARSACEPQTHSQTQSALREGIIYNNAISKVSLSFSPPYPSRCLVNMAQTISAFIGGGWFSGFFADCCLILKLQIWGAFIMNSLAPWQMFLIR